MSSIKVLAQSSNESKIHTLPAIEKLNESWPDLNFLMINLSPSASKYGLSNVLSSNNISIILGLDFIILSQSLIGNENPILGLLIKLAGKYLEANC